MCLTVCLLSDWSKTFGYLDNKVGYRGSRINGEIHFKISVGPLSGERQVWLCGQAWGMTESLKHAEFFLDANVPPGRLLNYTPDFENRVQWHKKVYLKDECKALLELPVGDNVLSVITSANQTEHVTGISHVIYWP